MGIGKSGRDRRWVRVRSLGCWILKAETGLLARDRRNQYFENIGVSTPQQIAIWLQGNLETARRQA